MRNNPLRFHPDPDNTNSGGNSKANPHTSGASTGDRPIQHTGGAGGGQPEQSTDDPDRATGELRQDVMPDLGQAEGGTPNPT
jgi:hypothetical protein